MIVSVVVITYNSSKYILETLESIKLQSYKKIELIISDDASRDNTLDITRKWLAENKDRFVNVKLISVKENSGIPANCNRGIKASKGEWIKIIAGDDVLLSNAIKDYVDFIKANNKSFNNDMGIIFSRIATFNQDKSQFKEMYNEKIKNYILFHKHITQDHQKKLYCRGQCIQIITFIFSRVLYDSVNGFDEEYPLREDRPFAYKIMHLGYKFYFMNQLTFLYRKHDDSVTSVRTDKKSFLKMKIQNIWKPDRKFRFPNLTKFERLCYYFHYKKDVLELRILNDENYVVQKKIFDILSFVFAYLNVIVDKYFKYRYKSLYNNSLFYHEILRN